MTTNSNGLPFVELFNWDKLMEQKVTQVSQFHLVRSNPFVYVLRKKGNEFELSRGYDVPQNGTIPFPWKLPVEEIRSRLADLGDSVKSHQIMCTFEDEYVHALRIEFDYYSVRFEGGRFYFPLTHSYLIDPKPYMEMLDKLTEQQPRKVTHQLALPRPF